MDSNIGKILPVFPCFLPIFPYALLILIHLYVHRIKKFMCHFFAKYKPLNT